jgi:diguanylate cyclase (GGDEF)-like protein
MDKVTENQTIADILFEYLRDIIYTPHKPAIDVEKLPLEFQKIGQGLQFLHECVAELRTFANALAKGKLNTKHPNVENGLAAPLMSIHGALTHITWLAQQVANGDYGQSLDFMGEFGHYFNTMTRQLRDRYDALANEHKLVLEKEEALEQTQQMLIDIIMKVPQAVVVLNPETGDKFFVNRVATRFMKTHPQVTQKMQAALMEQLRDINKHNINWELIMQVPNELDENETKNMFFSIYSYYVPWQGQYAVSHIIADKTFEKEHDLMMTELSYKDELTGMYNRRYGMDKIQKWVAKEREFCIVFVDIDYLKFFNDTYGHKEGDGYILQTVDTLRQIPDKKVICRMGGDEFMILKEHMTVEEMDHMLNQLRQSLVDYEDAARPDSKRSFSYGISFIGKDFNGDVSEVLHEADYKMYQHKLAHKASRT